MDFELRSRGSKLQAEQERRRQDAAKRLEQERRAKVAAAAQAAAIEQQLRQKRLEQARKEEQERRQAEEDQRRTAGISYKERLRVVRSSADGDKITLPPSALESLSRQDAVTLGPMLFELTAAAAAAAATAAGDSASFRVTHGGVLEFVAEEGTVGLPLKVLKSLGWTDAEIAELSDSTAAAPEQSTAATATTATAAAAALTEEVVVRYVRLPKATLTRVVPRTAGLSQVSELRAMLEHNLRLHATLTQGDWLEVWHRGKQFEMVVAEVQPEAAATIIDADVEIHLDLPEEAQAALTEKAAADRARTLRAHIDPAPAAAAAAAATAAAAAGHTLGSSSNSSTPQQQPHQRKQLQPGTGDTHDDDIDTDEDLDDLEEQQPFNAEQHSAAMWQRLPPEPPEGAPEAITILIRSRGPRLSRRFLRSDPVAALFDFCEAAAAPGAVPGRYRVVTAFPRRVLTREEHAAGGCTFEAAGLTGKQEAVILEPLLA